jgi:hypothetical protein
VKRVKGAAQGAKFLQRQCHHMCGELPGLFMAKKHAAEYVAASLISHLALSMFLK